MNQATVCKCGHTLLAHVRKCFVPGCKCAEFLVEYGQPETPTQRVVARLERLAGNGVSSVYKRMDTSQSTGKVTAYRGGIRMNTPSPEALNVKPRMVIKTAEMRERLLNRPASDGTQTRQVQPKPHVPRQRDTEVPLSTDKRARRAEILSSNGGVDRASGSTYWDVGRVLAGGKESLPQGTTCRGVIDPMQYAKRPAQYSSKACEIRAMTRESKELFPGQRQRELEQAPASMFAHVEAREWKR